MWLDVPIFRNLFLFLIRYLGVLKIYFRGRCMFWFSNIHNYYPSDVCFNNWRGFFFLSPYNKTQNTNFGFANCRLFLFLIQTTQRCWYWYMNWLVVMSQILIDWFDYSRKYILYIDSFTAKIRSVYYQIKQLKNMF